MLKQQLNKQGYLFLYKEAKKKAEQVVNKLSIYKGKTLNENCQLYLLFLSKCKWKKRTNLSIQINSIPNGDSLYRQRFGLFSYCPNFSQTDTKYKPSPPRERNQDGTIKIGPKNFINNPMKKGYNSVFANSGFLSQGDRYVDPFRQQTFRDMKDYCNMTHANPFKPSGSYAQEIGTGFKHLPETERANTMQHKRAGKNFTTSPLKQGISALCTFEKYPEHVSDYYQPKRTLQTANLAPWRPQGNTGNIFTSNQKLYSQSQEIDLNPQKEREKSQELKQKKPWIPNKLSNSSRTYDTIGKFPEYIPQQQSEKPLRPMSTQWHYTTHYKSIPNPSIASMKKNIERDLNVFNKLKSQFM